MVAVAAIESGLSVDFVSILWSLPDDSVTYQLDNTVQLRYVDFVDSGSMDSTSCRELAEPGNGIDSPKRAIAGQFAD